jgi:HPt (histidine-containing phosphotransfer) domain-containing protein
MTESNRVSAFIEARQSQVLARAVEAISTVDQAGLGAEAHRLAGTLGTFDLAEAAAVVRELERTVNDPDATDGDIARARASALQALRVDAEARP